MIRRPEQLVLDWKCLLSLLMQSSEAFQLRSSCLAQNFNGKESLVLPRFIRQLALGTRYGSTVDARLACSLETSSDVITGRLLFFLLSLPPSP